MKLQATGKIGKIAIRSAVKTATTLRAYAPAARAQATIKKFRKIQVKRRGAAAFRTSALPEPTRSSLRNKLGKLTDTNTLNPKIWIEDAMPNGLHCKDMVFLTCFEEAALIPDFTMDGLSEAPAKSSVGQQDHQQRLADRMEALAIELRSMSDHSVGTIPTELTLLSLAEQIYSARRKVDKIFDMPGFAVSPAWDIMLDLYLAKTKGREISVSSASIGAACPPTTALRWLQVLEDTNLILRKPDPLDKRRTIVELTASAVIKIEIALSEHL